MSEPGEIDWTKITMPCPKCGSGTMVVRQNRSNGSRFMGCSNWPIACANTAPIPEYALDRKRGGCAAGLRVTARTTRDREVLMQRREQGMSGRCAQGMHWACHGRAGSHGAHACTCTCHQPATRREERCHVETEPTP